MLSVAVGCTATEEETDDGAGALSEAECTPKAEAAERAKVAECLDENAFSFDVCMGPAESAIDAYERSVEAARAKVQAEVDAITGDCRDAVAALSCAELGKDAGSDYARAAAGRASDSSPLCRRLRVKRLQQCDADAADDIKARLGADHEYVKLSRQYASQWGSYWGSWARCAASGATSSVATKLCSVRGRATYASVFATCRRECAELEDTACAPEGYESHVRCGRQENVRGFSFRAGRTCEDGVICKRTDLCEKYDDAVERAADANETASCAAAGGEPGALVAEIVIKNDKATGVRLSCKPISGEADASEE